MIYIVHRHNIYDLSFYWLDVPICIHVAFCENQVSKTNLSYQSKTVTGFKAQPIYIHYWSGLVLISFRKVRSEFTHDLYKNG